MRFEHLDLNLLVALDALLKEPNLTRVAEKLNVTQSAMSGILRRLREFFDDELLVSVGRKMQPTPYALELQAPIQEVLLTIRSTIITKQAFEPSTSKRHFRVVASDYLVTVLLAEAIQSIYQLAPHVTFEILTPNESTDEMLSRGEVDLVIVPENYVLEGYAVRPLFDEGYVCVVWENNTEVDEPFTIDKYLTMGHVTVGFGRNRQRSIDEWIRVHFNVDRRLEVVAHGFNTLPKLVVGTNRIVTMHRRLAEICIMHQPLKIVPMPISLPVMRECMVWHGSKDSDPMHRWLREQIIETVKELDSSKFSLQK